MSFVGTQDAKDRIRQAIDIVDLVGSYIPLRREGRIFKGLCPWHDDSKPSLQVNPDRKSWKCWVCNIGGDIFNFVMQREGIDFREALEMLADRAGIPLTNAGPRSKPGDPDDKKTLYQVMAWAEQQFRDYLRAEPNAEVARRYFVDRRLTPEMMELFQLGFAPDSWQWLIDRASSAGYSQGVLNAAGLVSQKQETKRYYDFFRGRVMFPIRDAQGRPIAFGARILPEFAAENTGKYINTRETRLFSKSEHVYALDVARDAIKKANNVIVVEGYMDVIMCHQHGLQNVVAVLGTALGPRHISLLRRYADRITLVLDGDEAGKSRTNEVLEMFVAADVDLRIATPPDELDPCEFLEERPADELRQLLDQAPDALEHAFRVHTEGVDLMRDTHQANQALESLLGILAKAPRPMESTSSGRLLREQQLLARMAREFGLEELMLRQRIVERRASAPAPRIREVVPPTAPPLTANDLRPVDAEFFEILVRHPELTDVALAEMPSDQLAAGPAQQLWRMYKLLADRGEVPEFSKVLGELETPELRSLLIELDELAGSKEAFANADAATRLNRLVEEVRNRFQAAEGRRQVATLEQKRLDGAQELQLLRQLVDQERKRQGIPAPTDG